MRFHHEELPNGLTIIGESNPSALSVAVAFWVRTGSRDETPDVAGVSHFLEHMVFKGTEKRTAFDVNRDFDRIGAEYNASTSDENTIYYAQVLPEYLPQVIDLLADILRPALRQEDFDMEKQVILDEIARHDDQPMSVAYEKLRELYFDGHPLANSVLGTTESITALKREQMQDYFNARYVPSNITVVAAGRFPWKRLTRLVKKHCGHWEPGVAKRRRIEEVAGTGDFLVLPKRSLTQEHVVMMTPGPPAKSPLTYAAAILGAIVGDYTGSRLYWELVDPGKVDSAGMSFDESDGTGTFCTWFSCEPELTQENLKTVERVLADIQDEGVTDQELETAKRKFLSRMVRSSERPMGRMQAIGHQWVYTRKYRSIDEEIEQFESVTAGTIRRLLDRYPQTSATIVAHGPLTKLRRRRNTVRALA